MEGRPRIGVLALQGAFREHARALRAAGADVVEVRLPGQLDGLDGLVIPGGESTTITKLAALYGLDEAIRSFERPIFGTCAGMILLDRSHLGLAAADAGADDVELDGTTFVVSSAPEGLTGVRESLESAGYSLESVGLSMVPTTTVAIADESTAKQVVRLVEGLEENDDVQDVYANFDIPEAVLEAVAS